MIHNLYIGNGCFTKYLAIAQANKKPPVRFFEIRTNKFHFSGEVRALKFVSMVFFWGLEISREKFFNSTLTTVDGWNLAPPGMYETL